MDTETIFRIILAVLIVSFAMHRGYYVKYSSRPEDATLRKREEGLASKIAGLLGIAGFLSTILYTSILNGWLLPACPSPAGCDGLEWEPP